MLDSIKKALLAGLGAAVVSREKLRSTLDEFVRRGEITQEQASRLFEVLLARGQKESRVLIERLAVEVFRLLERTPFVTRREHVLLESRVRSLEASHGASAPDEVEPAAGAAPQAPDTVEPCG